MDWLWSFVCLPPNDQRWSPWGRPWPGERLRKHILKSLALASKTQVLGLGLAIETYKSSNMFCLRLEYSIIVWFIEKKNNQKKNNLSFYSISLSIYFLPLLFKNMILYV